MLLVRVVIFRYVALFWNQSTSEVTGGLNIEVKFHTVSPPVEIRGGQANIGVFFMWKDEQNTEALRYTSGGLKIR